MDIVHGARMAWGENLAAHRQGGMAHKVLFEGEEGSPDNFVWVLANEGSDYYSPRHRHAWDQVRLCLEGSIPISRDLRIDEGEVGYFPEGVPYGPQEGGPDRLTLVLQVGGASGLGYLSARQLREARAALAEEGVFEGGVFRRTQGEGKANLDAYEALWRHATGRPIDYPKPRYKTPILMRPGAFAWRAAPGFPGVRVKRLASFAERGLELELLALDKGSVWRFAPSPQRRLALIRSGEGRCESTSYEALTAVRLEPGEAAALSAAAASEIFVITLALAASLTT
ncbi:MAG TPA: hypothetical protein VIJ94_10235 [Caulobacteraceae bacterium]